MGIIFATGISVLLNISVISANPVSDGHLYPETAMVVEIESAGEFQFETVVAENHTGFQWAFYTDPGDFYVGDAVALIMNGMGTPCLFDDQVVSARVLQLELNVTGFFGKESTNDYRGNDQRGS